ncbi:MAG: hypothetical protein LBG58_01845 [Planctomycetaceae bacterium]|nr:hypothetical protein [Planctomycetaceae bacterium]
MSLQMAIGQDATNLKTETKTNISSSLSFHITSAKDIFAQGDDIDLRFMFRNDGNIEKRICTTCKKIDLFIFFFGMYGQVNDSIFWYTSGGKISLSEENYSYLSLRPREFFSFTHTVNEIMKEGNDDIVVKKDNGTMKKGDIITGKHVITVNHYNQHGENCFRGVLKAAGPIVFEIKERGKVKAGSAVTKTGGLEFSAVLAKKTFVPKEDILVDFTFTNTSKENVAILAEFEPFDAFFSVNGQNEKGEQWGNTAAHTKTTNVKRPDSPRYITLEPRESFGFRKKLNDLMSGQDTQEGKQQVNIKYVNQFGEEGFKGELSSPKIEFDIIKTKK